VLGLPKQQLKAANFALLQSPLHPPKWLQAVIIDLFKAGTGFDKYFEQTGRL
jgi:hypothetical protein